MVISRLAGGVGNQLFQYAAGRMLSERHGVDLALDISLLDSSANAVTQRKYELGNFQIRERFMTAEEVQRATLREPGMGPFVKRYLSRVGPVRWRREFYEASSSFDPRFHRLGKNVLLAGYFQSEKYFAPIRDIICREIALRAPLSAKAAEAEQSIRSRPGSVSLHIRRGDYATNPAAAAHHGLLPREYFTAGASAIGQRIRDPHFFIFSDDAEWASTRLRLDYPATVLSGKGMTSAEELLLISTCEHHIISNSSFSWWGAWLSNSEEKIVMAPKNWYADSSYDDSDMVPPGWLRI